MTVRLPRAAFGLLLLLSALPAEAQEPDSAQLPGRASIRLDTVYVRGGERVSAAAVRTTARLHSGQEVDGSRIQNAIRRLMATGDFETVEVYARDETPTTISLVFEVEERPFIREYAFRGLERVSAQSVRDTVEGLEGGAPLDPGVVLETERVIGELLIDEGVRLASVDTSLVRLEDGYRLTFEVQEGTRLAVAEVDFRGNRAFSDAQLVERLRTKPEGFLWFRTGKFDPQVLREDLLERLPAFYGERGYIDFSVLSDTLIVDPESGKARLVIEVEEGPRYRLGSFEVEGNSHFATERLARVYTSRRRSVLGLPFGPAREREQGEIFNQAALQDATLEIQQLYRNEGYLYAQVEPRIERTPSARGASPTVDVTLYVREGQPFYVDEVRIAGNDYTHESVIRDRLFVYPGDLYNEDRLIQSYQSISGLGFFETPVPTPAIDPDPETGTVDLTFEVEEKRTGSINFGASFGGYGRAGGLSGFLGYSQPNLFGQAKQANVRAEFGWRNTFQASYTDPSLFGTRRSGSVSVFHMNDRYSPFGDGRSVRTGGSLRYGMPFFDFRWTRAFLGYTISRRSFDAVEEDCEVEESIFCQPSTTGSSLSFAVTRETTDHPVFPTSGTRQSANLEQTGGPVGGDGNFRKFTGDAEWWVPVASVGGTQPGERPIRLVLGLKGRTGAVFGDASRFPLDRFFLGGTNYGEPLRGYEEATITPRGYFPRGTLNSLGTLGNAFLTVSAEGALRLTDQISISLFGDAGNIWTDPARIDPTRLFRGAGVGVSLVTPFGPLGLDYAYGFDKPEPGWQFHFKLGPGF
ncbi:MAG: outer membrane protein assembly factor BamA [Longimicrobiaceae bacterium]